MSCLDTMRTTMDWTAGFQVRAAASRTPISATLELTHRCNLRCGHCYLGDQAEQHRQHHRELDTEAVQAALTEWAAAGCLYLLITGGDPLLRPDFPAIYRHAREQGLVVTVFCNGTLVTDELVALFRELPPRKVEISLYGATPATADAVTGVPGSHARTWAGIRRLQAAGIRLGLKTMVLTTNAHEIDAMAEQARAIGVEFRHDSALCPCLPDHSPAPLQYRVAPVDAVRQDMAAPEIRRMWRESITEAAAQPQDDRLYNCLAGQSLFHADPFGNLAPCLMTMNYRYDARGRPFHDVWAKELAEIRTRRRSQPDGLLGGPLRGACSHCPAANFLETGDEELDSEYMKETALLRYQAVMNPPAGETP